MRTALRKKTPQPKFNAAKFASLVHYLCHKASDNPSILGKTKLSQALWYSDAYAYVLHGKSITGEKYVKHQFGPVPCHIDSTLRALEREKAIVIRDAHFLGRNKKEFISLKQPSAKALTAEEMELAADAFTYVCFEN